MIAIIVSRFNESITQSLLDACQNTLEKASVKDFRVFWVPGAFEIPVLASKCLSREEYEGVIALGAVIQGETDHYEHVCRTCSDQLARLAVDYKKPVIHEVLACRTLQQAVVRSSQDRNNKGIHAAIAYLEMRAVLSSII